MYLIWSTVTRHRLCCDFTPEPTIEKATWRRYGPRNTSKQLRHSQCAAPGHRRIESICFGLCREDGAGSPYSIFHNVSTAAKRLIPKRLSSPHVLSGDPDTSVCLVAVPLSGQHIVCANPRRTSFQRKLEFIWGPCRTCDASQVEVRRNIFFFTLNVQSVLCPSQ